MPLCLNQMFSFFGAVHQIFTYVRLLRHLPRTSHRGRSTKAKPNAAHLTVTVSAAGRCLQHET